MNAQEAKALAALNKKNAEETVKLRTEKLKNADSAILYKHFSDKIDEAVKAGKPSTSAAGQIIEFAADRFANDVITDVVNALRAENYNVTMEKHNAYNKLRFEISWI